MIRSSRERTSKFHILDMIKIFFVGFNFLKKNPNIALTFATIINFISNMLF